MLGTIVNAAAIFVGTMIGLLFRGGIRDRFKEIIMDALGMSVFLIGVMGAIKTQQLLVLIISLAVGSIIGEALDIEQGLQKLGMWIERKTAGRFGEVSKGFVTASLLFCVGSMAIVGSLESGLTGNHQTLFAKSLLDGISSIVFGSAMGIGVAVSAVAVLLYQGVITVAASFLKALLVESTITELSAVGSVLIMCIGINILGIKKIRVGNMLPAILGPLVYFGIKALIH